MGNLQRETDTFSACQNDKEKIDRLCEAFTLFSNETTTRLENSYLSLKEELKKLNDDLQQSNLLLQNKVSELDVITGYLTSILENIVQGILFIDLDGIVTTYNQAAERILGVGAKQVLFHDFWQNFNDDVFNFSMRAALEHKHHSAVTCISYTKPGNQHSELEVATAFVLKSPSMESHEGKAEVHTPRQGMIVMLRDVTEIHQLQTLANRNDRMKLLGEMAAQVAHEIRNPLGGIKGFASLLKRDLTENPQLQHMADYIIEGTDNLNRLVSQILHYARPLQPHLEKVNLISVLQELQQHVRADASFDQQHINIDIHTIYKEFDIIIDPSLFKAAMLNLIVNASQAMPEGGVISIELKKDLGHAILIITDTGIGISEENLTKIFSPFFTTKEEGNGLGLAETQKIIQAHGGTIEVNSTLGSGTTFIIKIPLKKG